MKLPIQIVFRNMKKSASIEQAVHERVSRLESFCDKIMRCRVTIALPHRHHQQGNLFRVGIEITVPGKEIAINREADEHVAYQDFETALRDAFDAARRQLQDYVRCQRGAVKSHQPAPHAYIRSLFPEYGYGFLETPDGRMIYFHAHSLVNEQFNRLTVGREVVFAEEQGNEGLQASSVRVLREK